MAENEKCKHFFVPDKIDSLNNVWVKCKKCSSRFVIYAEKFNQLCHQIKRLKEIE